MTKTCDHASCDRPVYPNSDSMFCEQHQEYDQDPEYRLSLERRLEGMERRLEALERLVPEDDLIVAHLAVQFERTQLSNQRHETE